MKLTKGKISKLYNVKKQSLKKNRNRRKCKETKTFRNKKPVNLANRTLKDFENIFKGGISAGAALTKIPTNENPLASPEPVGAKPAATPELPVATQAAETTGATPELPGATQAAETTGATPELPGATPELPGATPTETTGAETTGDTQESLRPGVPVIPHQQEEEEINYGENEMNQDQSHSSYGQGQDNYGQGQNNYGQGQNNYGQGQNNYGQDDYQNSNSYGNNSSSSMMGTLSNYMSSSSGYGQNNFDESGSSYGYGQNNYGQGNYGQSNYGQGMGMGPTYSETDQSSSKSNTQGVSQSMQTILDYLGNTIADKVVGRMSESGGQQNGFNALNASNNTMGSSSMGSSSMGSSSMGSSSMGSSLMGSSSMGSSLMGSSSMYDSSQYGGKKHTRRSRINYINKTRRNK